MNRSSGFLLAIESYNLRRVYHREGTRQGKRKAAELDNVMGSIVAVVVLNIRARGRSLDEAETLSTRGKRVQGKLSARPPLRYFLQPYDIHSHSHMPCACFRRTRKLQFCNSLTVEHTASASRSQPARRAHSRGRDLSNHTATTRTIATTANEETAELGKGRVQLL